MTARELSFDVVPNPRVVFTGRPERNTEWSSRRQSLPQAVEPGVTYRDIGIQLKIVSVFADIDRIVAEALLKVRLDNVSKIIDRTLTTIDKNPQVFERVIQGVENVTGTVRNVADTALGPGGAVSNLTAPKGLLSQTVNALGQTVQRTVDETGNVVERALDNTGAVVNQRTLGSVLNLGGAVLNETTNAAGQTARRVRDTPGAALDLTLDQAGRIVNPRVISRATGTLRM